MATKMPHVSLLLFGSNSVDVCLVRPKSVSQSVNGEWPPVLPVVHCYSPFANSHPPPPPPSWMCCSPFEPTLAPINLPNYQRRHRPMFECLDRNRIRGALNRLLNITEHQRLPHIRRRCYTRIRNWKWDRENDIVKRKLYFVDGVHVGAGRIIKITKWSSWTQKLLDCSSEWRGGN